MKSPLSITLAVLFLGTLAGCSQEKAPETSTAPTPPTGSATTASYGVPQGSVKVGDKAVCVVCAVKEGKPGEPEEVKATIDYQGKTYAFCNLDEKAEFISNPAKYAGK